MGADSLAPNTHTDYHQVTVERDGETLWEYVGLSNRIFTSNLVNGGYTVFAYYNGAMVARCSYNKDDIVGVVSLTEEEYKMYINSK